MMYLSRSAAALREHVSTSLLIAILSLLSSACSQIREDVGQPLVVDEAQLAAAADYHDILRVLGPPHRLSTNKPGMVFLYEEIDLLEQQLGVNLKVKNVALFKAVVASGAAERRLLLVFFDHHGIVQAYEYREGPEAEASGGALQFLNQYGLEKALVRANTLEAKYGERFKAPQLLKDKAAKNELI